MSFEYFYKGLDYELQIIEDNAEDAELCIILDLPLGNFDRRNLYVKSGDEWVLAYGAGEAHGGFKLPTTLRDLKDINGVQHDPGYCTSSREAPFYTNGVLRGTWRHHPSMPAHKFEHWYQSRLEEPQRELRVAKRIDELHAYPLSDLSDFSELESHVLACMEKIQVSESFFTKHSREDIINTLYGGVVNEAREFEYYYEPKEVDAPFLVVPPGEDLDDILSRGFSNTRLFVKLSGLNSFIPVEEAYAPAGTVTPQYGSNGKCMSCLGELTFQEAQAGSMYCGECRDSKKKSAEQKAAYDSLTKANGRVK